jgi:hypothetical protein
MLSGAGLNKVLGTSWKLANRKMSGITPATTTADIAGSRIVKGQYTIPQRIPILEKIRGLRSKTKYGVKNGRCVVNSRNLSQKISNLQYERLADIIYWWGGTAE